MQTDIPKDYSPSAEAEGHLALIAAKKENDSADNATAEGNLAREALPDEGNFEHLQAEGNFERKVSENSPHLLKYEDLGREAQFPGLLPHQPDGSPDCGALGWNRLQDLILLFLIT